MEIISEICVFLILVAILAIPILFIIFIIRWAMGKPKKWVGLAAAFCAGSILPLAIIGTFTDPANNCVHEYSIVEEVAPTCTKSGQIVKECSLCGRKNTEDIDMVDHSWETESVVSATCTKGGYITERCAVCDDTRQKVGESVLGHDLVEVSRKEATQDDDGEIVYQCSRCDETEVKVIDKLSKETETTEPPTTKVTETTDKLEGKTIKFNNLELIIGEYSLVTLDYRYSEHNGKLVVRIPVTVTNLSKDAHSLNLLYYKLFGTSGSESESIWIYFDDDVAIAGSLMPGKSYTKYFHILYDGDGIYTIMFDDMFFDEETVEIKVKNEN